MIGERERKMIEAKSRRQQEYFDEISQQVREAQMRKKKEKEMEDILDRQLEQRIKNDLQLMKSKF